MRYNSACVFDSVGECLSEVGTLFYVYSSTYNDTQPNLKFYAHCNHFQKIRFLYYEILELIFKSLRTCISNSFHGLFNYCYRSSNESNHTVTAYIQSSNVIQLKLVKINKRSIFMNLGILTRSCCKYILLD